MVDSNTLHQWITLYQQGYSFKQIAKQFNCSSSTIVRYFKLNNITPRKSGGKVTFDINKAQELYKQGLTIKQVAQHLGVNKTAVFEQFKKLDVNTSKHRIDKDILVDLYNKGYTDEEIASKTDFSISRIKHLRLKMNLPSHNIIDWVNLFNNPIYSKYTISQVVDDVTLKTGLSKSYIRARYKSFLNIPTISKQERESIILNSTDIVVEKLNKGNSIRSISIELKIPQSIIHRIIKSNNIEYKPKPYRMTDYAYKRLTNIKWCKAAIKRLNNNGGAPQIVKLLKGGVGIDMVLVYFKRLGLKLTVPVYQYYPQLTNYNWLATQYKLKSYGKIVDDLGISHPIIRQSLINANIAIKTESRVSKTEIELRQYIQQIYSGTIQYNNRKLISPYELDIVLPDIKIAIEFCGIYWHSEKFKPNNYHLNKLQNCNALGYRLIQIFEDEWEFKREIVKDKIASILSVNNHAVLYARKTQVDNISFTDVSSFLNQHHIQGADKSSIRLCLKYNTEVVAVMTFKRNQTGYDLNRFASKGRVVGGFSKLLNYFRTKYPNQIITTFADLRWSDINDNVYIKNGFKQIKITPPSYHYYDYISKRLKHRMNFQRKHLINLLGDKFDPNLSERQNANNNGYYAVYDCGHIKYMLQ